MGGKGRRGGQQGKSNSRPRLRSQPTVSGLTIPGDLLLLFFFCPLSPGPRARHTPPSPATNVPMEHLFCRLADALLQWELGAGVLQTQTQRTLESFQGKMSDLQFVSSRVDGLLLMWFTMGSSSKFYHRFCLQISAANRLALPHIFWHLFPKTEI